MLVFVNMVLCDKRYFDLQVGRGGAVGTEEAPNYTDQRYLIYNQIDNPAGPMKEKKEGENMIFPSIHSRGRLA